MSRERRRRAFLLALAVSLAGCEGDQAGAPSAPPPAPPPPPPRVAGPPAPLALAQQGAPAEVRVSDLFVVAADQRDEAEVEARTANETVATARLDGTGLMAVVIVTPVNQGETSVAVSLKTSAGSATQTIPVTVGPPPPRPAGDPPRLTLFAGGSGRDVPVAEYFTVDPSHTGAVEVEAHSEDESVAKVRLQGTGLMSVVTVEPVRAGDTWVRVVVRTPAGSATQWVRVTVLEAPAEPPMAIREPKPITLVVGGSWQRVYLRGLLTTGDWNQDLATEVAARSENQGVVTVRIEGEGLASDLIVTPVNPGETTVAVTARNPAGVTVARIPATVVPAEPLRVIGRLRPIKLVVGAKSWAGGFEHVFAPPGFLIEARSLDESVVVALSHPVDAGTVHVEPVGAGETIVVLTARNAAGAVEGMVRVIVLDKLRIGLVSRMGTGAAPPVPLEEGAHWNIEIRPLERGVSGVFVSDPVVLRIATDAPAEELLVPESITADDLLSSSGRIFFPVKALADDTPGEPERTYTVSLVSAEGLPPWMELSDDGIRVTVLDSPPAGCEDLRIDASLDRTSGRMRRGTFRIQAPHPATSVSWAGPYLDPTGQGRTMITHLFPERLPFRGIARGFEQEVRLRWWDGDLRLTVQAPGCEPVELHCDEFTCEVR